MCVLFAGVGGKLVSCNSSVFSAGDKLIRRAALVVIAVTLLSGSVVQAASYEKWDGTIVYPIVDVWDDAHGYSGNNLEPYANLTGANLTRLQKPIPSRR